MRGSGTGSRSWRRALAPPEKYVVPGSRALLELLRSRGIRLYLASGTDQQFMRREADLLGLTPYFDGGVFGALDDYRSFSKKILIERIIGRAECAGEEMLAFGDGYVEIENVKAVGGVAVGVATDEPECRKVDEWKRKRLISAGADYIIPNYLCLDELQALSFRTITGNYSGIARRRKRFSRISRRTKPCERKAKRAAARSSHEGARQPPPRGPSSRSMARA